MSIVRLEEAELQPQHKAVAELRDLFFNMAAAKGRPVTYNLRTYGCQLNEADSEKIHGMFAEMGINSALDGDDADIVILNTCAVRENAEDRLFGNLGEFKIAKKKNRDMVIAVCGCMMKVPSNVERIKKSFPYVDLVFDPQQIHNFPSLLLETVSKSQQNISITDNDYIADDKLIPIQRQRKFRALVPIMYGCNNFCSFCIVPYTRGRERSRDFDSVISELEGLAAAGYKEVMLLGQNVNSYGKGSADGKTFPDLLRAAAAIKGFSRIRFMSSHPKDISDEVIEIMASEPNIEKHLHLPLQSGSDRLLKIMNRPYDTEKYMHIVDNFRRLVPGGSISTDIIVGFPGETEEDFEGTMDIVRRAKFDSAFTFQYSIRPGTKAAEMEDQVPHDIVTERFGRLLKLQNDLVFESNKAKIGKVEEVLIEGLSSTSDDILTGRTKSNHLVNFTVPDELKIPDLPLSSYEGLLCDVKFTKAKPYSVEGVMERIIND
ncbi:MAG: tRNA (N6-isopentenyl adenosine(37)-C2)-methylthiotransferase MiaB [Saccharofermentans sp.]|nr:tRNA (N6-isopentenyl adenosine(37)-C2)-methylthiotransferase MiaB [Saccharofermentans sp.]